MLTYAEGHNSIHIAALVNTNGVVQFTDTGMTNQPRRFYRAVVQKGEVSKREARAMRASLPHGTTSTMQSKISPSRLPPRVMSNATM